MAFTPKTNTALGTAPGLATTGLTAAVPKPTGNQPAQPTAPGAFMPTPATPITPTKLVPPPAVISSDQAQKDLQAKQQFADQATAGMAAQQQAKDMAAQAAQTTIQTGTTQPTDLSAVSQQIKSALAPEGTTQANHIVADGSGANAQGMKGQWVTSPDTGKQSFFAEGSVLPFDYINKIQVVLPSGNQGFMDDKGNYYTQDGKPVDKNSSTPGSDAIDYQKSIQQINAASDANYQNMQKDISNIKNGTFPLNSWQQGIIDSVNAKLQQTLALQKIANANYEGGLKVALFRSGEIKSPEIAQGEMMAAASAGIAKINELENNAASEIAKLQEGFQKEDFDMVMKAYDAANTYLKNKSDAIQNLYKTVTDHEDKLKQQEMDVIKAKLESDKFTWQQKQDAIDNAYKQGTLDETKRKNLADEAYKQQTLAIQNRLSNQLAGMNTKPVKLGADGKPDPKAQEDYLAQFSPDMQAMIKGFADYTLDPTKSISIRQFKGATGLTMADILPKIKEYDPTYDMTQFQSRQKFMNSFNAGALNTQIGKLNTVINHIDELKDAADELAPLMSGGLFAKSYNNIAQLVAENSADPRVVKYKAIVDKVGSELAGAYGESTGGERSKQEVVLDINNAPAQKDAVIGTTLNLLSGLTTSMYENYQSVMGKAPDSNKIIRPTTESTINDLKNKGIDISIDNFIPNKLKGASPAELQKALLGDTTPASLNNKALLEQALTLFNTANQANQ